MAARHARIGATLVGLFLVTGCGPILPTPNRDEQVRVPWVLSGAVGNRLDLNVMLTGTDCQQFAGVDVVESDDNVQVRAWVEDLKSDGCFAVRRYHAIAVELNVPLGDRALEGCMIAESSPHDMRESCAEIVDL